MNMTSIRGRLPGALVALLLPCCALAAQAPDDGREGHGAYAAHALVSDGAVTADFTDTHLVNPWGVAFNPNAPVWIANNGTGTSTLYDGTGTAQALVVQIPPAANGDGAINAFDPISGHFLGSLRDADGHRLHLDGLWGISFGNGVLGQATNALYYAAGTNHEQDGVYGVIRAVDQLDH